MPEAALPAPLPLFPLQTVLFPGGVLNLKVFEARYQDMVTRCLRENSVFGVICLRLGKEVRTSGEQVQLEEVGVVARLDDVTAEEAGILRVRCVGMQRFQLMAAPTQQADGLWLGDAESLPDDAAVLPAPEHLGTVQALAQAIVSMKGRGQLPFAEPYRLDDAAWVANRWCEILPISLAAKQRLMQLEEPLVRLSLVRDYLKGKGVVSS